MSRAAVTIVSNNYLPAARTLAKSFKEHHPDATFYTVLVDTPDPAMADRSEPFKLLQMSEIGIPDHDSFAYKYTVMELNTAVKPFALSHIFNSSDVDKLLYIDPDIEVFRPLDSVWDGLDEGDIVLTPHMRAPFNDNLAPSELSILQAGTYNLGFVGLRRSRTADRLLAWWEEKLFNDCVVDIPVGLFVDQKWMDLVPGYFPSTRILADPSLNVAYWNLHDRQVTKRDGRYVVDGDVPLSFFHFSGYSPVRPDILSKHQNRHNLADLDTVRDICLSYGQKLIDNGYIEDQHSRYAFGKLPNGISVAPSMRAAIRLMTIHGESHPSPIEDPDAFCRFLVRPRSVPGQGLITPIEQGIFAVRPDVARYFGAGPTFRSDGSSVRTWLQTSGRSEEGLADLLDLVDDALAPDNGLRDLLAVLSERSDVFGELGHVFQADETLAKVIVWAQTHGVAEHQFDAVSLERLERAAPGVRRILNLYFVRPDLQQAFVDLGHRPTLDDFAAWLRHNAADNNLTDDEIDVFASLAAAEAEWWQDVGFVNGLGQRDRMGGVPTIFAVADPSHPAHGAQKPSRLIRGMVAAQPDLVKQAKVYLDTREHANRSPITPATVSTVPLAFPAKDGPVMLAARQALADAVGNAQGAASINIGGMFLAPTGMGEAARALLANATAAGHSAGRFILPTRVDDAPLAPAPYIFDLPRADAVATITVANADMTELAHRMLPRHYWADRNIGYWLWETDRLPGRFRDSARFYDEIWTSSSAVADAIALTIDKPARVLPLAIDLDALDRAQSRRAYFGLDEEAVVFAFFFDMNSVLERKNPAAVIAGFKAAFGDDPRYQLLLKVNGASRATYQTKRLRASIDQANIILMERTLDRAATFDLLASIDVYCSLHRFEGFGLSCAEAMALGKPVIATGHSGNMEFMDEASASLVPFELFKTERPYGPYPIGTTWAEPDAGEVVRRMQALADADARERLGQAGNAYVRARLSPSALADRFNMMLAV